MLLCSAPCLIHLVNRGFHKDQHIQILEQALHAGISAMCVIFSATIVPAAAYACCQDCLCVRTAVERHRQPATLCLPRQGPGRAVACTSVQSLEAVPYTHFRAHETKPYILCRLLHEKISNTFFSACYLFSSPIHLSSLM